MHDELDRTEPKPLTAIGASEDRPLRIARGTKQEIEQPASALAPRPLTTIPWFETVPAPRIAPEDLIDEPATGPVVVEPAIGRTSTQMLASPSPAMSTLSTTRTMLAPLRSPRASVPPPFRRDATSSSIALPPVPRTSASIAIPRVDTPSVPPPIPTTSGMFQLPPVDSSMHVPGSFPVVPMYAPPASAPPFATSSQFGVPADAFASVDVALESGPVSTQTVERASSRRGIAMILGAAALGAVVAVALSISVRSHSEPNIKTPAAAPNAVAVAPPVAPVVVAQPVAPVAVTPAEPSVAKVGPLAMTVAPSVAPAPANEPISPATVAPAAPTARPHHHHSTHEANAVATATTVTHTKATTKATTQTKAATKTTAQPKTVAMVAPTGTSGILMVSSKPPCSLVIDGKVTRLTTPQRSLRLAPGPHDITFINAQARIRKNVSVTISANQTNKLIRDFTH
ncbi:hypothetical protein BH11MYX2_BH11MYX2_38400 [soil metagenome]